MTAKSTALSDSKYRSLVSVTRPLLQRRLADAFRSAGISAIVSPVTPLPPVLVSQGPMILVGGKEVSFTPYFGRNVIPGSTAGVPGLVLPAGLTRTGLPVGIEFDGSARSDRDLLALGLSLEQVLGSVPPPSMAELYQTWGDKAETGATEGRADSNPGFGEEPLYVL
jgi:Asp-tRNA(Asn)/Glu-tRNA(Gln) amidotransferase A subunit family amidase